MKKNNTYRLEEKLDQNKQIENYKIVDPAFSSLTRYPLPLRDLVDNKRYFREGGM